MMIRPHLLDKSNGRSTDLKRPEKSPKRNEGAKTPSYKYNFYPSIVPNYINLLREKTKQYEPESEQTSVNI